MNKKRHLFLLSAFASALILVSCGQAVSSAAVSSASSSEEDPQSSSGPESSIAPLSSESDPSSIVSTSISREPGDENWIYYAEDRHCALGLDYAGRDFMVDGIEEVTLFATIDGDTAHFTGVKSGKTIKSRFYGVDTPESTGQVQPWGKPASLFTKEKLEKAAKDGTIVVATAQDDYGVPKADSTGSRYVSLIWISLDKKNCPFDELVLLNLMIVEYGLSWVKAVADMPQYADAFYDAVSQAQLYELNMHSGKPDPYFNYGDYEDVSLLDIKREVVAQYRDSSHKNAYDNAKVRVQGTVAGFANHIIYITDFCYYYNEDGEKIYKSTGAVNEGEEIIEGETGEYAGLNIFAGMSSIPSKFTTPGNYIQVCGLALDSQFGFQVTDGSFKTKAYDENDAMVLIKAADNTDVHALKTFEYTAEELSVICKANDYVALNCRVKVTTPTTITRSFDAESGAIYLYSDLAWSTYFTFTYKPYPNNKSVSWTSGTQFEGHQFLIEGVLAIHKTTTGKNMLYMYPCVTSDIVWVDTDAE